MAKVEKGAVDAGPRTNFSAMDDDTLLDTIRSAQAEFFAREKERQAEVYRQILARNTRFAECLEKDKRALLDCLSPTHKAPVTMVTNATTIPCPVPLAVKRTTKSMTASDADCCFCWSQALTLGLSR